MKYKIFLLVFLMFGMVHFGCQSFVEDINVDPNNPTDAPIEAVMNAAFTGIITGNEGHNARIAAMWSRQFTGTDRQYAAFEVYTINSADFNWDMNYIAVQNLNIVIEKANTTNDRFARGVAKVVKAHTIGMMASLWGNIPFSEAVQFGIYQDPNFDGQESVYQGVQTILDEAITDLSSNPSGGAVGGTDIFFGGDASKWLATAYSIKARFYLHVNDYTSAANAAANGILDAANDWKIPHTQGIYLQDMNFYHSFGILDRSGYMTAPNAILPRYLDANTSLYRGDAKTDESARFSFNYVGDEGTYDLNYDGFFAADSPFPLVTAAETHLILAECAQRNNDNDGGITHLNHTRAINAAQFPTGQYDAYELSDFEAGGMAAIPGKSTGESLLHEIIEEKYCSLIGQIEVFNDLRRTNNLLELPAAQGSSIPERLLIPQGEIDANSNAPSPIPGLFEPTPVNK